VFNDLELYLMGMAPAGSVGSHFVFNNQNQVPCAGCTLEGPVTTVTLATITAHHGARVPSYAAAQHQFRVATIVATRNRLLNATEMAFFSCIASANHPVPYSLGISNNTYPFYATQQGRLRHRANLASKAAFAPLVVGQAQWKNYRRRP
jgi:hypothetical protein